MAAAVSGRVSQRPISVSYTHLFQRVLGKIRQGLVHCVMLLWRSSDADTADGGVVLVQILKVYTATDAALQQDLSLIHI